MQIDQPKEVWKRLERLRRVLNLDTQTFADQLNLSESSYQKLKFQNSLPSAQHLEPIYETYGVDVLHSKEEDISWQNLSLKFGSIQPLPERYQIGAKSRIRTTLQILNYLDLFLGSNLRNEICDLIHLDEAHILNAEETVSIHLLTDICNELHRRGYPRSLLYSAGEFSAHLKVNDPIRSSMKDVYDVRTVYEKIFLELTRCFDENFTYKLENLTDEYCLISAKENPDVLDALKVTHLGSSSVCASKAGLMASFPVFIGERASSVQEISCIHRGDPTCRLLARFHLANQHS